MFTFCLENIRNAEQKENIGFILYFRNGNQRAYLIILLRIFKYSRTVFFNYTRMLFDQLKQKQKEIYSSRWEERKICLAPLTSVWRLTAATMLHAFTLCYSGCTKPVGCCTIVHVLLAATATN